MKMYEFILRLQASESEAKIQECVCELELLRIWNKPLGLSLYSMEAFYILEPEKSCCQDTTLCPVAKWKP